ncbi:4,5-DOPA dioxygenase extradiol [Kingella negevensis]|uniref:4,5-DOPA-extradiol-dioxygenase n=1 Tax=Kingella negevensis TaxID=1522312 RepID=UPI00050A2863|nr:4,5-DOPA dioxygenase extradiol [Kingella negevensis]MDK4687996.1 4,5-DOPA dioxygenase extradiol [Kingella negevensis]WII91020.1 4,5-DOPA dioxygenase extradiol [Kingella negevensis]
MNRKMPALFLGHGSPMAVLQPELSFNRNIRALADTFPKPKTIVCISAHWYDGLQITGATQPETIYDFYGFPDELYQVDYPAAGSPELAQTLKQLLGNQAVINPTRGLDHGAWAVLKMLYPDANIPVVQLGLDVRQSPQWHFDLARSLKPLREQGVLIVGSGNVVHNLRRMNPALVEGYDWANAFREHINQAIVARDDDAVIHYLQFGEAARLSVPTNEHFLPLLYVLAQREDDSRVEIFNDEMDLGSISMTSVIIS